MGYLVGREVKRDGVTTEVREGKGRGPRSEALT